MPGRAGVLAFASLLLCGVEGESWTLQATKDTVHWGYFSKTLKPQVTIKSGDSVTVEMVSHHAGDNPDLMITGDKNLEEIFAWAPTGPGTTHEVFSPLQPHSQKGPCYLVSAIILLSPATIRTLVRGSLLIAVECPEDSNARNDRVWRWRARADGAHCRGGCRAWRCTQSGNSRLVSPAQSQRRKLRSQCMCAHPPVSSVMIQPMPPFL